MIRRFDAWVGSRVFVPIVIWICQRAGASQHRFHNYAWMAASWLPLYATGRRDLDEIGVALIFAIWRTYVAAYKPDQEGTETLTLRILFIVCETIHWGGHALYELGLARGGILFWGVNWDTSCPVGLIGLAAEYALTIRTIPPRETSRSRALSTAA